MKTTSGNTVKLPGIWTEIMKLALDYSDRGYDVSIDFCPPGHFKIKIRPDVSSKESN